MEIHIKVGAKLVQRLLDVIKHQLHARRTERLLHVLWTLLQHPRMLIDEHLSQPQYRQLLRVAAQEGCNYFTFNIPNTVCNDCGQIDKRYLKECPHCHSKNVDYLTRIIGYMKRVSNFSAARQEEAARRYYATQEKYPATNNEQIKETQLEPTESLTC